MAPFGRIAVESAPIAQEVALVSAGAAPSPPTTADTPTPQQREPATHDLRALGRRAAAPATLPAATSPSARSTS